MRSALGGFNTGPLSVVSTSKEQFVSTATEKEYKYTFHLKAGSFINRARGLELVPGDIYHTNDDMIKLEGRDRWELVQEGKESIEELKARIKLLESKQPPTTEEDELDRKSIKELRTMAAEMVPPVDLTTCTGKTEIVNAIRQALDAA